MSRLRCASSNTLYKNDIPHICSKHAAHPSLVVLDDHELLASVVIGEAFEAPNSRTHLFRSQDGGLSWTNQGLLFHSIEKHESDVGRLSINKDGSLTAVCFRANRERQNQGYTNPANMGFVETDILITKSIDKGYTWSPLRLIQPNIEGPYESQSSIVTLSDGRWILPTSLWRNWDGSCPNGMKAIALVSYDQGASWPDSITVMDDYKNGRIFFESCIIELPDGRLLATAWEYDEYNHSDLPVQYAISQNGKTFNKRYSTGLIGQTTATLLLDDGRILSVYRRMDKPGLWANLARLEDDQWINEEEIWLWGNSDTKPKLAGQTMSKVFSRLKFGAPRLFKKDKIIYVIFWCYEECQGIAKLIKIEVS